VDAAGGGDFTTIRAGYDSLVAAIYDGGTDTLIVRAGFYPETLFAYPAMYGSLGLEPIKRIVCPDGPSVTIVQAFTMTCFDYPGTTTSSAQGGGSINIEVAGLGFAEPVCIGGGTPIRFTGCTFNAGFRVTHGGLSRVQLWASTFYHEARFDPWQWEPVVDCRFVRCRVSARNNDGWLKFIGCTFEGPIDTAVVVSPVDSDAIWFEGCAFRDCGVAISARKYSRDGVRVIGCRFDRIRHAGILDDAPSYPEWYEGPRTTRLDVVGCEFADCGTGVRWGQPNGSPALVESTTIVRSSGTPFELHGGG
jgi:hypothetical protein